MATRRDISEKAKELDGRKYAKYGRGPTHGLDCVGVVIWVGKQLGLLDDVEIPPYTFPPDPSLFDELFPKYCDEVKEFKEGSIIVLKGPKGKPQHIALIVPAIYTGTLHCLGAIVTPSRAFIGQYRLSADVRSRIYKIYDYRNVEA